MSLHNSNKGFLYYIFLGMELLVSKITNISECQDRDSAVKTIKEFKELLFFNNREKWMSSCPPGCNQTSYSFKMTQFHINNWIESGNEHVEEIMKAAVRFALAYEDFVIEEQIETLVYDIGNFLAAVGGNLGLFLGFSCLTLLLEIMQIAKQIIVRYI